MRSIPLHVPPLLMPYSRALAQFAPCRDGTAIPVVGSASLAARPAANDPRVA